LARNIIVAGAYKSGSNHIAEGLARTVGGHRSYISGTLEGWNRDPQRIDIAAADSMFSRQSGMVYLQHIWGTARNVGILKALDPTLKVVAVYRGLLPSLHSLYRYEELMSGEGRKSGHLNALWSDFSASQKWMWVTSNAVPWYYNFYASWDRADIPVHFVKYEDHFNDDQMASAKEITQFLGAPDPTEEAWLHKDANYTKDRTEYEIPGWVRKLAWAMTDGWGPYSDSLKEEFFE
jgi:hypothetical protein